MIARSYGKGLTHISPTLRVTYVILPAGRAYPPQQSIRLWNPQLGGQNLCQQGRRVRPMDNPPPPMQRNRHDHIHSERSQPLAAHLPHQPPQRERQRVAFRFLHPQQCLTQLSAVEPKCDRSIKPQLPPATTIAAFSPSPSGRGQVALRAGRECIVLINQRRRHRCSTQLTRRPSKELHLLETRGADRNTPGRR